MNLSGFVCTPCKTQLAFEFKPTARQKLVISRVAAKLRENGFIVELETPVLATFNVGGRPVSIFADGKILVKETNEKGLALRIAQKVSCCV